MQPAPELVHHLRTGVLLRIGPSPVRVRGEESVSMKRLLGVLLASALMVGVPTAAHASGILIDFSNQGFGGTITASGGGNYIGADIAITSVLVSGAPTSGQFDVQNGALNFNTSTGAFSISGGISDLGVSNQTLLTGTISKFDFAPFINGTFAFTAEGSDTKSSDFLTAIGLNPATPFQFGGFSISGTTTTTGVYAPFSTDVSNTAPEPASLALFGSGLLLGIRRLKRRTA